MRDFRERCRAYLRNRYPDAVLVGEPAGTYGLVFILELPEDTMPRRFALKTFDPEPLRATERDLRAAFLEEVKRGIELPGHTNVLATLGYDLEGADRVDPLEWIPLLRMAYCERSLDPCHLAGATLEERYWLAAQTCCGVAWIHRSGLVHGDLKPANVLVRGFEAFDPPPDHPISKWPWLVGVADLGWSRAEGHLGDEQRGHRPYLAPEIFQGQLLYASDVYALGIVLAEVLGGRHPAGDTSASKWKKRSTWQAWSSGGARDLSGVEDAVLREVLESALHADAGRRPTLAEISHVLDLACQGAEGIALGPALDAFDRDAETKASQLSTVARCHNARQMARLGGLQLDTTIDELTSDLDLDHTQAIPALAVRLALAATCAELLVQRGKAHDLTRAIALHDQILHALAERVHEIDTRPALCAYIPADHSREENLEHFLGVLRAMLPGDAPHSQARALDLATIERALAPWRASERAALLRRLRGEAPEDG